MNILAFESSCDETAAAVVRDGRTVLSDVIASQADMHAVYGGVVPEIASRKHVEAIVGLADQALARAGLTRADIDAVAVTYAPGLIGALLVGVNFAKAAAYGLGVPLIPVHHVRGHIAANYITHPELEPPFVCLCVSGGNTMLVDVRDYTDMAILGATRDDAAGECFDKVARVLGIGYPGGAPMDALAQGGDDRRYELPRAHVADAPLDMSFSGLKTAVLNLAHNAAQKGETLDLPGLAASFAAAVSDTLVPRTMEAARRQHEFYCQQYGGTPWEQLDSFKRYSNVSSSDYMSTAERLMARGTPPETLAELEHMRWCRYHYIHNWTYGVKTDSARRIHSCLVPYHQLSEEEKVKDIEAIKSRAQDQTL